MALLRDCDPVPEASVADLGRRRVAATHERLVTAEGIPTARLSAEGAGGETSSAPAPPATGEGRVEFAIVAGE
jgi:hypothetical protein